MLRFILIISLGASAGAVVRWLLGLALNSVYPPMPLGTLAANLIGGYLIGLAVSVFACWPSIPVEWGLFVVIGFLGGLTTFSSFSLEVTVLIRQGQLLHACGLMALHVCGSLTMTFLGLASFPFLRRILGA